MIDIGLAIARRVVIPAAATIWRSAKLVLLAASGFIVFGCSSDDTLAPFTSDGCSLFPDESLINADDWCSCCFEHDIAYWRGGTIAEREAADTALADCVREKTNNEALASLMFEGVRIGGSPYFFNWYRWGYGWSFDRTYQALSPAEHEFADALLTQYFAGDPGPVCRL